LHGTDGVLSSDPWVLSDIALIEARGHQRVALPSHGGPLEYTAAGEYLRREEKNDVRTDRPKIAAEPTSSMHTEGS